MMLKNWWKFLSILILIPVIALGFLVPLKSGVADSFPDSLPSGARGTLFIEGYNSNYLSDGQTRAWLKLDSAYLIQADEIRVKSETAIEADFEIPKFIPSNAMSPSFVLILDNPTDGYSLLPAAVQIDQDTIDVIRADAEWPKVQLTDIHYKDGMTFPYRNILYETIRNTFFHVPMWFGMVILFYAAFICSFRYLFTPTTKYRWHFLISCILLMVIGYGPLKSMILTEGATTLKIIYHSIMGISVTALFSAFFITISPVRSKEDEDRKALSLTQSGVLLGVAGILTGMVWATYTWGKPWTTDVKLNASAIAMLMYFGYLVLRSSFDDKDTQARLGSVYSIIAFVMLIPLLFIIPRMFDSLHPGNGGNPGLGGEDLDNTMRMIFYPAIIGWTLLGVWISELSLRYKRLKDRWMEQWEE